MPKLCQAYKSTFLIILQGNTSYMKVKDQQAHQLETAWNCFEHPPSENHTVSNLNVEYW